MISETMIPHSIPLLFRGTLFNIGDEIVVDTRGEPVRFLLISEKALHEPVAWHGPIVMNTQSQIQQALRELNDGNFIK